jgi:RNA polymerase sigma factor (sigma-70 family)
MNVHVSYKASRTPDIENQIKLHIEKLRKRLQVFRPDLIHLHATLEQNSAREGFAVSLNLRLPSGQMAVSGQGVTMVVAVKAAFDDLQEQLGRHKARLRERCKRTHPRGGGRERPLAQVPFEETLAAVKLPAISSGDITSWVDVNLHRLIRFVERELRYREANGQLRPGVVAPEEVIDETIATALGDSVEKPERLALEPWLFRVAMRSLDELVIGNAEGAAVSLEQSMRPANVEASDEAELQFHQPDEALAEQDNIPDRGTATPEEIASSDEMIAMVEAALKGSRKEDREAFLLYAVEGFSPEEIAIIGDRSAGQVRASILAARERLRKALPHPGEFKDKLLHHGTVA